MNWIVLVGTLLGTVIGTAGTITSQYLAGRVAERKDRLTRAVEARAERLLAIEAYFEVYQEIEGIASGNGDRPAEVMHRMWFLHNRLALIVSEQLRGPLDDLSNGLNTAYWSGTPDAQPVWEYLREPRSRFREAARAELAAFEVAQRP